MLNYIKSLFAVLLLTTSVAYADNNIYIDQSGDSNTITVTQGDGSGSTGSDNIGGTGSGSAGTGNRAKIYGNNNVVNVDQAGTSDTLKLNINNNATSGFTSETRNGNTYNKTFNYSVTGDSSTGVINITGTPSGGAATASSGNLVNINQSGKIGRAHV